MHDSKHFSHDLTAATRTLHGHEHRLADGEVLYRQGEACDAVFLIDSGYIKLAHLDPSGAGHIIALLNAGELLTPDAFKGVCARQTATAKGRTRLYAVSLTAFRALVEREPSIVWPVFEQLARRQHLAERRLQANLSLDVRGRLAFALHELVTHYGGRCTHGHDVDVPLTQQELAEMVGASRQVVNLQLKALREAGVVSYTRQFICIEDMRRLGEMGGMTATVSDS